MNLKRRQALAIASALPVTLAASAILARDRDRKIIRHSRRFDSFSPAAWPPDHV